MREAQDAASEPIAITRFTRGSLPKLKPGTVGHLMKPQHPPPWERHRPSTAGRQTPQWHIAPPEQKVKRRRRARPATATARRRPPPPDTGRSQRPAAPDADQLS